MMSTLLPHLQLPPPHTSWMSCPFTKRTGDFFSHSQKYPGLISRPLSEYLQCDCVHILNCWQCC